MPIREIGTYMNLYNEGVIKLDHAIMARIVKLETEAYQLYTSMFCAAFIAALEFLEATEPAAAKPDYLESPEPGFHPGYIIRRKIEYWAPTHTGNHFLSDWHGQEMRRMVAGGLIEETRPRPGWRSDTYYRLSS